MGHILGSGQARRGWRKHPGGPPCICKTLSLYWLEGILSRQWLDMQRRIKTAQVNLRVEPALKDAAERAAADDHRSLTSLIEKLLSDYLRERGYLPKGGGGPE